MLVFLIQVTAVNSKTDARLSGSALVTINVVQPNAVPPFFPQTSYSASIYDNFPVGALITNQIQARSAFESKNAKYCNCVVICRTRLNTCKWRKSDLASRCFQNVLVEMWWLFHASHVCSVSHGRQSSSVSSRREGCVTNVTSFRFSMCEVHGK
jgi:hypothetical protein